MKPLAALGLLATLLIGAASITPADARDYHAGRWEASRAYQSRAYASVRCHHSCANPYYVSARPHQQWHRAY